VTIRGPRGSVVVASLGTAPFVVCFSMAGIDTLIN
jgi:hypothetical protein